MEEDRRTEHLQEYIEYRFSNQKLLDLALRHSSYLNEHGLAYPECNERLEYLGDAVLELASSRMLFQNFPEKHEGELTRMRAALVCEPALASAAEEIGLGSYLQMGRGEEKTGGRNKGSILSDALEALIGAIYLDSGFEAADAFIYRFVFKKHSGDAGFIDNKTRLQERMQKDGPADIQYHTDKGAALQDGGFRSEVVCCGVVMGVGTGHSKKEAEQNAAGMALQNQQLSEQAQKQGRNICI